MHKCGFCDREIGNEEYYCESLNKQCNICLTCISRLNVEIAREWKRQGWQTIQGVKTDEEIFQDADNPDGSR